MGETLAAEKAPTFTRDGKTYVGKRTMAQAMSNFGVRRKLRGADSVEGTFVILEAMFDEDALEALDDLDIDDPAMVDIMSEIFGDQNDEAAEVVTPEDAQFLAAGGE